MSDWLSPPHAPTPKDNVTVKPTIAAHKQEKGLSYRIREMRNTVCVPCLTFISVYLKVGLPNCL